MESRAAVKRIDDQIAALKRKTADVDARELLGVVQAVVDSMGNDLDCAALKVYADIGELAMYIKSAREDIAALCPSEITEEHLPNASDELDAIVEATEKATNGIMESAEAIEALTERMSPDLADEITTHITTVYEACGFQDITGQRINKVVTTLKHIEKRIEKLLEAFDAERAEWAEKPTAKPQTDPAEPRARPDEHLMNGPQLDGEGISQADVDALLDFD